jgi:enoyl-[acyl-carrier protein] reductase III
MNAGDRSQIVLVAGGSRGIGRAVSLKFAARARTVFVNYVRNDAEAGKTRTLVESCGAECVLIRANLQFPEDVDRLFKTVLEQAGHLDVFVHCAALGTFKPTLEIKLNQWDLTMNISARSFLLCVQQCVPLMRGGRIVALSSLGSVRAVPNYGAMGAAKSALEALVRYLAVELAPRGIQVNAVSGGFVATDSLQSFPQSETFVNDVISRTPAGRIGHPDDLADVVMFLTDPASRWICGQTIIADGGLSLR